MSFACPSGSPLLPLLSSSRIWEADTEWELHQRLPSLLEGGQDIDALGSASAGSLATPLCLRFWEQLPALVLAGWLPLLQTLSLHNLRGSPTPCPHLCTPSLH